MRQYIASKENENIKLFKKISSAKKYRSEYGLFPLEGVRLVADAVGEASEISFVIVAESAAEKLEELLLKLEEKCEKILIVPDELAGSLALTQGTQGIFAVCRIPENKAAKELVKKGGKYVVLVQLQDPGNMGTIIRTADAMGVDGILAVNCCDIYNPKTVRSTMGSLFRMKIAAAGEDEAFEALNNNGIETFAAVIDGDAVSLTDCRFENGAAVLIGNEGNGLPAETVRRCDKKLTIHMNGNVNSLNAATAASIIMWELTK
ncbi:MAG: TrmH family RNA methyltransferase [Oscillospiraceae bacterium]